MSTYSEKLRDPRWQKVRLEVLNRDLFTCALCDDTETELHIHHIEYNNGKEQWDYGLDNFMTLCKHCHSLVEYLKSIKIPVPVSVEKQKNETGFYLISVCIHNGGYYAHIGEYNTYYDSKIAIGENTLKGLSEMIQHLKNNQDAE